MKGWGVLLVASISEIGWAVGLKYTNGFTVLLPSLITIGMMIISFFLFAKALLYLPMGTAYAVFTGIGTTGTTVYGILFLQETMTSLKVLFFIVLIMGIIGLQITGKSEEKDVS